MTKETLTLSHKELDRLQTIRDTISKRITQAQAAAQLGLSVRQIKRIARVFRARGANGLASKRRGKQPNNLLPETLKQTALSLVRERYSDFSPTFAHEKLTECHGLVFSVETLRQWMIGEGLWKAKCRSKARIHQSRPRRAREGELVQIDGSPHDWFEGRAPYCSLIVFIDDATGKLQSLRFAPSESTKVYMETLLDYLDAHGRPVALYSDKHSVFRVNARDKEGDLTQFGRALSALDIDLIYASTPQAKGRVERANQTLQDRLVKEMRLRGINSIEQANAYLPEFMETYNQRFAVHPQNSCSAHRPVLHSPEELALILSEHDERKLSKNLSFRYEGKEYQLKGYRNGYRLRYKWITVCKSFTGTVTLLYEGQPLDYRVCTLDTPVRVIVDEKSIQEQVDLATQRQRDNPSYKPPIDHPWKRPSYKMMQARQQFQG